MGISNEPPDLLKGTLDLLILRTLQRGPMHGYGIAQQIRVQSEDILQVGEGSLYPALQRLLLNDWVTAHWGASENNRRARYYTLRRPGASSWRLRATNSTGSSSRFEESSTPASEKVETKLRRRRRARMPKG
jgi:transcriptional regulator